MSHWSERFIGTPYRDHGRDYTGLDCWGVPYLHHLDVLGIKVPGYEELYCSAEERNEVAAAIGGNAILWPWKPIEAGEELEHDIVVYQRGGIDDHCGVVVEPGWMLHVAVGGEAGLQRYGKNQGRWRRPRFYRHVEASYG